jgi:DNA-binding winged helix-turn-helix (wHTH) protein/tetratricopeptide (TPR) repeat protein
LLISGAPKSGGLQFPVLVFRYFGTTHISIEGSAMAASGTHIGRECFDFGPFHMDPAKQVLLCGGEPVPLTPKAFQLLLVLVRRSDEVVSKDELMRAVWPDTFVEETNLTRNIFALRKALGETEQHRLIVTVPGRGYRFSEQVRVLSDPPLTIVAASHSRVKVQIREKRSWILILIAAAVGLALAAGAARVLIFRRPALTGQDTVVLASFANSTADPVFDGTLRQGVEVQLEQSPFLSLVSEQRIHQTLRLMGQPSDARLAGETARDVCQRAGAVVVIEGSIAPLGHDYVLGLRARNCRTGHTLDEEQEQVARKEDVLAALSHISSRLRSRLGESRSTVQEYSTPLAEATTPSLDALKAYSAGWQVHAAHGASAALPFFQRAVEIDPQFAMAHASVGRIYADLDQSGLAAASIVRAWQLRDRTSEREKFFITSNYEILVTGNLEAAQQTAEAWARTYPRDALPHNMLGGMVHKTPGRYEKALAESRKAIDIDPYSWISYYNEGVVNVYLGHMDDGKAALRAAAAHSLDADEFIMLAYDIDFLNGDRAGMEDQAARARARPGGENWISAREGFVAAYSGHLHNARMITHRAVAQAQQAGQPERAALWAAGAAVREALVGNREAATEWAHSALELSDDREVAYGCALAMALVGDTTHAQALADHLEHRFPENTAVRFNYLPTLRAVLALNRAQPQHALELLQTAAPHELGIPPSAVSGLFGALYPIYVRGQAYLALNKPSEAAAEFQKILDHRGIVTDDPIGALAHIQIARAYTQAKDRARAKAAYQEFLVLWENADADNPILQRAKADYAKL